MKKAYFWKGGIDKNLARTIYSFTEVKDTYLLSLERFSMKSDQVTHTQNTATTSKAKMGKFSVNKGDIILLILSLFVPPICVWKRKGFFSRDFLLNLLLFVFFYVPAIIHADYVIYETSEERISDYESLAAGVQEAEQPSNGDFGVDLEAGSGDLPQYSDVVATSQNEGPEAAAAANAMDNKVQH